MMMCSGSAGMARWSVGTKQRLAPEGTRRCFGSVGMLGLVGDPDSVVEELPNVRGVGNDEVGTGGTGDFR
jgi:hypothetical protein